MKLIRRAPVVLAALMVAGCGGARVGRVPVAATVTTTPPPTTLPDTTMPATTLPVTTTTLDPGTLPQTHQLPSTEDPVFAAHVQQLWSAIVADDPSLALPSFFPRSAYLQVKAIANPGGDYQNRLIAWFELDVHAAHAFLGAGAAAAQLTGVSVPTTPAVWVLPGGETNRIAYYRVYGSRLTFHEGGRSRSFGIFSFISWRGEWYVVHLGPSSRSTARGILYEPQD